MTTGPSIGPSPESVQFPEHWKTPDPKLEELPEDIRPKGQLLLDQAISCIDATLLEVGRARTDLMNVGISAYTIGMIMNRLAESAGTLCEVQRMLPGYKDGR